MRFLAYLQSLAWCIFPTVLGNVEKTIFLAPEPININKQLRPNLDTLRLGVISPSGSSIRRQLSASFPRANTPKGTSAWFLLQELNQGQRYEVRICWAATVRKHGIPY